MSFLRGIENSSPCFIGYKNPRLRLGFLYADKTRTLVFLTPHNGLGALMLVLSCVIILMSKYGVYWDIYIGSGREMQLMSKYGVYWDIYIGRGREMQLMSKYGVY